MTNIQLDKLPPDRRTQLTKVLARLGSAASGAERDDAEREAKALAADIGVVALIKLAHLRPLSYLERNRT